MPDPDWTDQEPGQVSPGTSKEDYLNFGEEAKAGLKGVGKGVGRAVMGISDVLPSFLQSPHNKDPAYRASVMAPGETTAEKVGIGVGSVGPYALTPELGLEGLAARGLANAPRLVRAGGTALGRIAQKGLSGGLAGGLQPAESPDERMENEKWGAGMAAGLSAVGVGGRALAAIPPAAKRSLERAFGTAIGAVLGGHLGHPWFGAYMGRHEHIGRLVTEALPKILQQAGKVRGGVAGAGAVEATEKEQPDWTDKPPGG